MPAVPLGLSAAGAVIGAIKKNKDQKAKQAALDAQLAAQQASASSGGGGGGSSWNHPNQEALAGFSQFAKTGGFSPEDLQNIRARALSPVRATYANAQREVNRQRAIQGGYSPGFGVLQSRMAREQGQATSDAATNAEAGIAQMVQQGKLAGLQGLAQYGNESGSSSGGGGDTAAATATPTPEKKKGFWGKLGGALGAAGSVALPILLNKYGNGPAQKPKLLPSRQTVPNAGMMPAGNTGMLPGFGS